jgi:hypothetical protein
MKDLKDFGTTCALIAGVMWLFRQIEDGPASVDIPIYSTQILVIPVFIVGMYFTFSGKHMVLGLLIMGGVAWYLFGGAM